LGNIRPTYIKRVAYELLRVHADEFTKDFTHNKQMVDKLTDVKSQALRNKIAGYVTRLKKRQLILA
jgi:small subunit ribosomal protein S17e